MPSDSLREPLLQDLTGSFQNMSISPPQQTNGSLVPAGHGTPSPLGIPIQPHFPMTPMIYRGHLATGSHYLMDHISPRNHVGPSMRSHFPLVGQWDGQQSSGPIVAVRNDFIGPRNPHPYHRPDGRRQNAMRVNRSQFYNAAGHHNHVDVNRIREGTDVRTTVST